MSTTIKKAAKAQKPQTSGDRLKLFRTEEMNNLTLRQIGEILNMDSSNYWRVEKGEKNLTHEQMHIMAERFHMNLNWYITGKGDRYYYPDYEARMSELKKQLNALMKVLG